MSEIQKFGIASTLIAAFPAGAMAADLPSRGAAPIPVFAAPAMGWTGFYVGAQIGAVASNARINGDALGYGTWNGPNGSPTQVTAGILAGYDRQMGNLVFGVLADVNARFGSAEGGLNGPGTNVGWRTSSAWDASLRARLGFLATDRALIYATGGLIAANYKLDNPGCPGCADWGTRNLHKGTRIGWTVGGGIEYKLDQSWSMKMEYLYADLGRKTTAFNDFGEDYYIRSRITSHTVRVGLNYKFGGAAGPVIASY